MTEAQEVIDIPDEIADDERIVRVLFFPAHFTKSETFKWIAYRTPAGIDEVSVIRLDYCNETFCKKEGKRIERPNFKANYYGLGVHDAKEIRSVEANVIYSPEPHPYHADIVIGFIPTKGEALPPDVKFKVEELARIARVYKDTNVQKEEWTDGRIA